MADNYLQNLMKRVVAMQKEALATVLGREASAVPYWPYFQNEFPYITNRLGAMTVDYETYSEDIQAYMHTVLMRLVVANLESGYAGDKPDLVLQYVEDLENYFRTHSNLTTDGTTYGDYTSHPDYLFVAASNGYYAHITGHTGVVVFQNAGIGSMQLGCEITLQVPFIREVY